MELVPSMTLRLATGARTVGKIMFITITKSLHDKKKKKEKKKVRLLSVCLAFVENVLPFQSLRSYDLPTNVFCMPPGRSSTSGT